MRGVLSLPDILGPWEAVACPDIEKVLIRVIGHAIPDRSAAAHLPPFAGPCFRGGLHGFVFETLGRVAGHRVETPQFLSVVDIECRDISAKRREFTPGVSNEDLTFGHPR